jgi:hypothetical protein
MAGHAAVAAQHLIDVIVQGQGTLSKAKRKLAEGLSDAEVQRIEKTVADSFAPYFQRHAP